MKKVSVIFILIIAILLTGCSGNIASTDKSANKKISNDIIKRYKKLEEQYGIQILYSDDFFSANASDIAQICSNPVKITDAIDSFEKILSRVPMDYFRKIKALQNVYTGKITFVL